MDSLELSHAALDACHLSDACSVFLQTSFLPALSGGLITAGLLGQFYLLLRPERSLVEGGVRLRPSFFRKLSLATAGLGFGLLIDYLFYRYGGLGILTLIGAAFGLGVIFLFFVLAWALKGQRDLPTLKEQFIQRLEAERYRNQIEIETPSPKPDITIS